MRNQCEKNAANLEVSTVMMIKVQTKKRVSVHIRFHFLKPMEFTQNLTIQPRAWFQNPMKQEMPSRSESKL